MIGTGPELLDAEGHSSITPLRRDTCRSSKSQSLRLRSHVSRYPDIWISGSQRSGYLRGVDTYRIETFSAYTRVQTSGSIIRGIVDANAPSYQRSSWDAIARKAAEAKKRKYARASEDMRSSFTPLVCSTDAVLHREYAAYQKRLASRLATKWDRSYSVVMAWVRVQTQFAIFRAVDLRLRGTRRRLVGLTMQDGAGLGIGH